MKAPIRSRNFLRRAAVMEERVRSEDDPGPHPFRSRAAALALSSRSRRAFTAWAVRETASMSDLRDSEGEREKCGERGGGHERENPRPSIQSPPRPRPVSLTCIFSRMAVISRPRVTVLDCSCARDRAAWASLIPASCPLMAATSEKKSASFGSAGATATPPAGPPPVPPTPSAAAARAASSAASRRAWDREMEGGVRAAAGAPAGCGRGGGGLKK